MRQGGKMHKKNAGRRKSHDKGKATLKENSALNMLLQGPHLQSILYCTVILFTKEEVGTMIFSPVPRDSLA